MENNEEGAVKYYTICSVDAQIPGRSGGFRYYRRTDGSDLTTDAPALLFGCASPEEASEVADKLPKESSIHALFPAGFAVNLAGSEVFVISEPLFNLVPESAEETDELTYYEKSKPIRISPSKRYADCKSFFKITGCLTCPDLGKKCLTTGIEEEMNDTDGDNRETRFEELKKRVKKNPPKILQFQYVSPAYTTSESFAPFLRRNHDFSYVEDQQARRKKTAAKAGNSRSFVNRECKACPLYKNCGRYRRCEGKYPNEDTLDARALEEFQRVLKKNNIPEDLFWRVQSLVGTIGRLKRCSVKFTGWDLSGDQLELTVYREKTSIYRMATWRVHNSENMIELEQIFGKIPSTVTPPPTRTKALFFTALYQKNRLHYGYNTTAENIVIDGGDRINISLYKRSYWCRWKSMSANDWKSYARYIRSELPKYMRESTART